MNNFTTTTDKKRKSLFGFSIKLKPFSSSTNNELQPNKRHNSVNYSNFAFSLINRDEEEIETIENERDGESFRSDSGNEFITHQENMRELEPEDKQRNNNKQPFRLASGKYNNKEKKVEETGKENGLEKQKNNNNNNYTQSFRSISGNKNNSHHNHGSVQNLVIRRQRAAAASTTKRFLPQGLTQLSRRPSVPSSSPLSIVGRLRKSFSTASLDEEDSAFCSAESSPSCSITSSSPESSPNKTINEKTQQIAFEWKWTELQKEKIEELEHQCIHSFGHKLVNNPKLAFTNLSNSHQIMLGEIDNNVLCAEGNVQFHLLSMIAPPNKKVVNIGSPSINDNNNNNNHWFHLSPSFRPYSKNNLEISR
uniref:Uncharacterized protein n=1 Tax=Meloidogyne enterolobii TaxID=390850 RepID=A0A6V7UGD4_MELEN|nr:unnamed protein product [Meloidogyne enterolobii]